MSHVQKMKMTFDIIPDPIPSVLMLKTIFMFRTSTPNNAYYYLVFFDEQLSVPKFSDIFMALGQGPIISGQEVLTHYF